MQFNLKIGGIKQMLSKDQMKKITGGYTGCENQYTGGQEYCEHQYGGHFFECYSTECGRFFLCQIDDTQGCH